MLKNRTKWQNVIHSDANFLSKSRNLILFAKFSENKVVSDCSGQCAHAYLRGGVNSCGTLKLETESSL